MFVILLEHLDLDLDLLVENLVVDMPVGYNLAQAQAGHLTPCRAVSDQ